MRPQVIAFIFKRLVLVKKSPSFQRFSLSFHWQLLSGYTLQFRMDMADRDTVIVDLSPQAADPRLKKITDSRSPETQKCNIQEIDEGKRITRKIFHFENCGTVYMDSLNAHNVKIKNCGNNVPNVTCLLFLSFSPHFCSHWQPTYPYHIIFQITVLGLLAMGKSYTHNLMQSLVVRGHLCHLQLSI